MQLSFNNKNKEFTIALRKRVDEYFASKGNQLTGNRKVYLKTVILVSIAVASYLILVLASPPVWAAVMLCIILGIDFAAIGFNVMHDGAHGSYSKRPWVNEMMAYSLNLMGGCAYFWKQRHNLNHHNNTNIEGHDEDIDIRPFIRTNVNQPRYWFHKYQHIYASVLYGLSYIAWIGGKDFKRYFTGRIAETKMKKMDPKEHVIFWVTKLVYFTIIILIPGFSVGFINTLIGYSILCIACGIVLSFVFQLAHVVEHTDFPMPVENTNKIDEDWTIHQLATTANFATENKIISWYVGGLNYQVEHHLFPRVNHIHYPAISKLVKEVCKQFNVRYIEYPTFSMAVRSHISHLKYMGAQA